MSPILEADQISFSYPHGPSILNAVSFCLDEGDICSILGPNGAGKTTLLNCLGGYLDPDGGRVLIEGTPLVAMKPAQRAQRIGFTAQIFEESADFEVCDYLALGCAARTPLLSMPSEAGYDRVDRVIEEFGITALRGKSIKGLSGGERQQVEIARTFVQDTDIILMDEPTNHLDLGNQIKVLHTIKRLSAEQGKTVVLTTHVPDHALLLEGKTAIIDASGSFALGPTEAMIDEASMRRIYQADIHLVYVEELHRWACLPGVIETGGTSELEPGTHAATASEVANQSFEKGN